MNAGTLPWRSYVEELLHSTDPDKDAVFLSGWGWDVKGYAPEAVMGAWLNMELEDDGTVTPLIGNVPVIANRALYDLYQEALTEGSLDKIVEIFQYVFEEGGLTPVAEPYQVSAIRNGVNIEINHGGGPLYETLNVSGDTSETVAIHLYGEWPGTFDAHTSDSADVASAVSAAALPLYKFRGGTTPVPQIADGMPQSVDGAADRWRVRIKPVTFGDGTECNARIVAANLTRVLGWDEQLQELVPGAQVAVSPYKSELHKLFSAVTVVDDHTIEIVTLRDLLDLERFLSHWATTIYAESFLLEPNWPIGYGAYVYQAVRPSESVLLERNPHFEAFEDVRAPDNVTLNKVTPGNEMRLLRGGQTDVTVSVPSEVVVIGVPAGYRLKTSQLEAMCLFATGPGLPRAVRRYLALKVWDAREDLLDYYKMGQVAHCPLPSTMTNARLQRFEMSESEVTEAEEYLAANPLTLRVPAADRHWIKNHGSVLQGLKDLFSNAN